MMKVSDIVDCLEEAFPLSFQESYDNSGLQIGDRSAEVTGILIAVDVDEAVLTEAIETGCNMVVTHHPLLFNAVKRLGNSSYIERSIRLAARHDLHVYAAHTNADNALPGINSILAEHLGLENCLPLIPLKNKLRKLVTFVPANHIRSVQNAIWQAGAGEIGAYDCCSYQVEGLGSFRPGQETHPHTGEEGKLCVVPETCISTIFPAHKESQIVEVLCKAHPYEEPAFDIVSLDNSWDTQGGGLIGLLPHPIPYIEFLHQIKRLLSADRLCYSRPKFPDQLIQRVAICGGSGAFMYKSAMQKKADIFLTGEAKYNDFYDAVDGPMLVTAGHYETEQYATELFQRTLLQKFPNFAIRISVRISNPVNYL
ncbi:hypothetical protein HQ45_09015 [Porphyromonas crevioricanis]|nr:hypothetical protein HQ45_09015 [Porphyromonas crevioricanis]